MFFKWKFIMTKVAVEILATVMKVQRLAECIERRREQERLVATDRRCEERDRQKIFPSPACLAIYRHSKWKVEWKSEI